MEIVNFSRYRAERACLMDRNGAETLVVCVKASWLLLPGGRTALAEEQRSPRLVPEYRGDPGGTSLLHEADLCPGKTGTDCVLLGHAYPIRSGATETQVTFAVGSLKKTVIVSGKRVWAKILGTVKMTSPQPLDRVPLTWENAYGGIDIDEDPAGGGGRCEENPVGIGFRRKRSNKPIDGQALPNIEDPGCRLKAPDTPSRPAGLAYVAPMWMPRRGYAGTYDDRWKSARSPLLPEDFDVKFFSAAPDGLASQVPLNGDETVLVEGASPEGRLSFRLPGGVPRIVVRLGSANVEVKPVLNAVVVEPDEKRVSLVWNGALVVHGKLYDVGWIKVQADVRAGN
jgi:hypothetical protein